MSDRRAELQYANKMEIQKSTWTRGSVSLQHQPDGLSARRLCFCSQWQTYSRLIRSVRLMRMACAREKLSDRHIQRAVRPFSDIHNKSEGYQMPLVFAIKAVHRVLQPCFTCSLFVSKPQIDNLLQTNRKYLHAEPQQGTFHTWCLGHALPFPPPVHCTCDAARKLNELTLMTLAVKEWMKQDERDAPQCVTYFYLFNFFFCLGLNTWRITQSERKHCSVWGWTDPNQIKPHFSKGTHVQLIGIFNLRWWKLSDGAAHGLSLPLMSSNGDFTGIHSWKSPFLNIVRCLCGNITAYTRIIISI